jgi:enolase-phosphatase E1
MINAIVTDIEGTTSSIAFVHEVLFPYARKHMAEFVRNHADDQQVREQLQAVADEVGQALDDEQAILQLIQWIDEDKKITPLKALQGMLWEVGYRNGDFFGHVYPDSYSKLCEWSAKGLRLYVYSSGSVKAQKLLFAHTEFGDMTPIFHGYFDTTIGGKREQASYERIVQEIGLPASEVLFLSDIEEELAAAEAAGLQTIWFKREGGIDLQAGFRQVTGFHDIEL